MGISGIWDKERNLSSKGFLSRIERKALYVSGILKTSPEKIIPASGLKGYHIENQRKTKVSNNTK